MTRRNTQPEFFSDKMENTVANIILQNMEDLDDGILMATTNLAKGTMDSAYKRRFLYKLKFDRPTLEVRHKIWRSMLTDVDDEMLGRLSQEFDFTVGQIMNIQKKKMVDEILLGVKCGYAELRSYCEQERIGGTHHQKMGFMQA